MNYASGGSTVLKKKIFRIILIAIDSAIIIFYLVWGPLKAIYNSNLCSLFLQVDAGGPHYFQCSVADRLRDYFFSNFGLFFLFLFIVVVFMISSAIYIVSRLIKMP
ncbi:hypothetical protein D4R52_00230 [bacterium]|nr:MAG: hypothetical protein D4R52_00230 [bacterium]